MAEIVAANELPHLSTERVWVETEKALGEQHPEIYWQVLSECGALAVLLPELAVSQGIAALSSRRAAHRAQRLSLGSAARRLARSACPRGERTTQSSQYLFTAGHAGQWRALQK